MGRALRRSDTDEGWINRELADLRRQIRELRAEKDLEAATISEGGLTIEGEGGLTVKDGGGITIEDAGGILIKGGDVTVADGGDIHVSGGGSVTVDGGTLIVKTPGDMLLQDPGGATVWQASTAPIKTDFADADDTGLSIPLTWTVLGFDTVPVPTGYVGVGHFIAFASCGDTMTGTGSVSVAVAFRFNYVGGTQSGWFSGPAVASPDNRIAVASSSWSSNFTVAQTPAVESVSIGAFCVRSFGTEDPGNGNFHVSGSVIFRRG